MIQLSPGLKKWWDTVDKITGRKTNHTSINIYPNVINSYFQTINSDDNYTPPKLVPIPIETRIPNLDVSIVEWFLEKQKKTVQTYLQGAYRLNTIVLIVLHCHVCAGHLVRSQV